MAFIMLIGIDFKYQYFSLYADKRFILSERTESREMILQILDHIDKTMVGTTPLDVVFKTDEVDALKSPENLQQIKNIVTEEMCI